MGTKELLDFLATEILTPFVSFKKPPDFKIKSPKVSSVFRENVPGFFTEP